MIPVKTDKFGIPIYDSRHILETMMCGFDHLINQMQSDPSDIEITKFNKTAEARGVLPIPQYVEPNYSIAEFDAVCQSVWFMPDEYKTLDIIQWVVDHSNPSEKYMQRVGEELIAFEQFGLINLLRWLKYFVDECRQNNVIWGVGRGSSVASYVLYVIGVHKIDPIQYDLDWHDFLR